MVRTHGLSTLARAECLGLLAPGGLGRIAATVAAVPAVFPVAYRLAGSTLVFRTVAGATAERAVADAVVAFEADEVDGRCEDGWFVQVVGVARRLEPAGTSPLGTSPFGATSDLLLAITDGVVSGHRITDLRHHAGDGASQPPSPARHARGGGPAS